MQAPNIDTPLLDICSIIYRNAKRKMNKPTEICINSHPKPIYLVFCKSGSMDCVCNGNHQIGSLDFRVFSEFFFSLLNGKKNPNRMKATCGKMQIA